MLIDVINPSMEGGLVRGNRTLQRGAAVGMVRQYYDKIVGCMGKYGESKYNGFKNIMGRE